MKTNTHIVPFFNKAADLKVGLNQLGLRNASEALFTLLLSKKCCSAALKVLLSKKLLLSKK